MKSSTYEDPVFLFSPEHIPYTPVIQVYQTDEVKWFGSDLEKEYRKKPHPVFGPDDIIYRVNRYGYRCPEFELRYQVSVDTIHVVTIAASDAFGTGLPEEKTYPAVFKQRLEQFLDRPVINWNLGLAGGSSDYISRTLISALQILKPDIVLINFPPGMARREYINDEGRSFHCMPTHLVGWTDNKRDWEGKDVLKAHTQLLSAYNNPLNLFKNYKVCESLCEQFGVMWLFSTYDVSIFNPMKHLIHADKLVPPGLGILTDKYKDNPAIGLARDMLHPGIQPNQEHAEAFLLTLQQRYESYEQTLKQGKPE